MKNNKKIKTALIFFIVLLIIVLCFNVGVYAAYVLAATDGSYTKPNGTQTSVKEALDEVYAKMPKYSIGDEVTFGGEPFYVIADKGATYELLAKYTLNSSATKQENAIITCAFSTNNYWSNETLPSGRPYLNLNTYLAVQNDTGSAFYKANNYAQNLGAISGRLPVDEDLRSLINYKDIIYLTYGRTRSYWLASACRGNLVWYVHCDSQSYGNDYFDDSSNCGVRPVIEIYKSEI